MKYSRVFGSLQPFGFLHSTKVFINISFKSKLSSNWVKNQQHFHTMTSSNGHILRVTGHLCGEFTGPGCPLWRYCNGFISPDLLILHLWQMAFWAEWPKSMRQQLMHVELDLWHCVEIPWENKWLGWARSEHFDHRPHSRQVNGADITVL